MLKTMTAFSLGFLPARPRRRSGDRIRAKNGVPLGATAMVPETDVAAPMGASEGCLWGLNRYNGVSCP